MQRPPAERRIANDLLALVRGIQAGRVATTDLLAEQLGVIPKVIVTLLANLTDEERDGAPWHRVVAKGGAIGRGTHRDVQVARLVREGVSVSPAAIVQDMARVAVTKVEARSRQSYDSQTYDTMSSLSVEAPAAPLSRSRGMKDRPT
jgi:methylated-DNA-protein-cysteine methyltransferase-like protein